MSNIYVGKIIAVNKQRAKVKIEQRPGEQRPKLLDCWNACKAKQGTRVIVGKQSLDEKRMKMIIWGIPALTAVAGAAFGRAIAHFFSIPVWQMGVQTEGTLQNCLMTNRDGFTVFGFSYPIRNGNVLLPLPPKSAMAVREI